MLHFYALSTSLLDNLRTCLPSSSILHYPALWKHLRVIVLKLKCVKQGRSQIQLTLFEQMKRFESLQRPDAQWMFCKVQCGCTVSFTHCAVHPCWWPVLWPSSSKECEFESRSYTVYVYICWQYHIIICIYITPMKLEFRGGERKMRKGALLIIIIIIKARPADQCPPKS